MAMYEAIKNFNTQFSYQPVVENAAGLGKFGKFVVVGMGGSALAAGLLKVWKPELDLIIHRDYGLPTLGGNELKSRLVILSSYSGNTEETLDAYAEAKRGGLNMVAIGVGGELIKRAKKDGLPYIELPDTGIQPRSALGFSLRALLKILDEESALIETNKLVEWLKPQELEEEGRLLAERLRGFVPVIYSSSVNKPIAYAWKTKFNETGKIPAFCNVLPELNHNEMTGFDVADGTRQLSEKFSFILLKDAGDHPSVQKRMTLLEKMFIERGFPVKVYEFEGRTVFHKIFSSLVLADWAAYYTAQGYDVEPEKIPMVEEFKKLMQK